MNGIKKYLGASFKVGKIKVPFVAVFAVALGGYYLYSKHKASTAAATTAAATPADITGGFSGDGGGGVGGGGDSGSGSGGGGTPTPAPATTTPAVPVWEGWPHSSPEAPAPMPVSTTPQVPAGAGSRTSSPTTELQLTPAAVSALTPTQLESVASTPNSQGVFPSSSTAPFAPGGESASQQSKPGGGLSASTTQGVFAVEGGQPVTPSPPSPRAAPTPKPSRTAPAAKPVSGYSQKSKANLH